jgi:hypothetical protein
MRPGQGKRSRRGNVCLPELGNVLLPVRCRVRSKQADKWPDIHTACDEFSGEPTLRHAPVKLASSDFRHHRGGIFPDGSFSTHSRRRARSMSEGSWRCPKAETRNCVPRRHELIGATQIGANYDLSTRFKAFISYIETSQNSRLVQ